MEFIDAAKALIAADSSPGQGTVEAIRFLQQLATSFGFRTTIQEDVSGGTAQANIFIEPSHAAKKLLLETHLDTTSPGAFALWSKTGYNPFQASIRGDEIYGLGAADVKLDFLCKLYAARRVNWSAMSSSAVLLGTYGEEEQMQGALRAIRSRAVTPCFALIGEPTDLHLVYSGKGITHLEIVIPHQSEMSDEWTDEGSIGTTQNKVFHGKAAHSSTPEMGENAVEKMFEFLNQLPDSIDILGVDGGLTFNTIPTQASLEFDLSAQSASRLAKQIKTIYGTIKKLEDTFKQYPNTSFDPPYPTINIGMIRHHPDHIKMAGAVRWSTHIQEELYSKWIEELVSTCKNVGAICRVIDVKRPFLTETERVFARMCKEEALKIHPQVMFKTQPVTNEANVFSRFGFECIVFGPGKRQNNAHTPEEHVSLRDLAKAEDFYFHMMNRVCI